MRTTRTIGFAIEEADEARLAHLTQTFGGGNRSAFLRKAMDVMERCELAQRLGALQAYGESRMAATGHHLDEIPEIVAKVLANPEPEAVAQAKLVVAGLRRRRRIERPDGADLSPMATAFVEAAARGDE